MRAKRVQRWYNEYMTGKKYAKEGTVNQRILRQSQPIARRLKKKTGKTIGHIIHDGLMALEAMADYK